MKKSKHGLTPTEELELIDEYEKLKKEIDRLRKALKFYANGRLYKLREDPDNELIFDDCGTKAKEALK